MHDGFGENLRLRREQALLTQEQLGRRTGLSARTIRRIERGVIRNPRSSTVRLLREALDLGDPGDVGADGAQSPAPPAGWQPPAAADEPVEPHQLPTRPAVFVERRYASARLNALVPSGDGAGLDRPHVGAVVGTAGVGKSALAVCWAHSVAHHFSDGQLHIRLHGHAPAEPPADCSEVLGSLLTTLGVPSDAVPDDADGRINLYRSLTYRRNLLVVIDGAQDSQHAAPFLPTGPDCAAVVTSRVDLSGLTVTVGAQLVHLDTMRPSESWALLEGHLGRERLQTEPAAAKNIIDRCSGLPMAVAAVASRATARPHLPLTDVAADLGPPASLDGFMTGELNTDVRALLASSYRALTPAAARTFRLLALARDGDLTTEVAACVTGAGEREIRRSLLELERAHLLFQVEPGRYVTNRLVRAYAREALADEPAGSRQRARQRLVDHLSREQS